MLGCELDDVFLVLLGEHLPEHVTSVQAETHPSIQACQSHSCVQCLRASLTSSNELGTGKYQGLACPHGLPGLMTTKPRTVLPSLSACIQAL